MQFSSYEDLRPRLLAGEVSCEEVVRVYLERIERHGDDNIYLTVFRDEAIERAAALDRKLREGGEPGRLFGLPMAIKDNISMDGAPLTCASKMLEGYRSVYDATVIRRLFDEDAIFLGKTNMDEFAMGSSNENSAFGPVQNPFDPSRVPGGSSGGSAAAVAAGLCMVALGSDTGGSVRQPAGFCDVVGLKPTYGRISRYGLVAFASSFDQIGVLSHSSMDAALVLGVMAGSDPHDATSSSHAVSDYCSEVSGVSVKGLKIGVPKEFFNEGSIRMFHALCWPGLRSFGCRGGAG